MPTAPKKNFTVFEFVKQFENYVKPGLKQKPLSSGERYVFKRFINFNREKVALHLCKKIPESPEAAPVTIVEVQNIAAPGISASFKGTVINKSDDRSFDFLYLVDSPVQLSTHSYELVSYFDAILEGNPLPSTDDEGGSAPAAPAATPGEEQLSEEDIENMSEDEIQKMMEQEVARTLAATGGDDDDAQGDIEAMLAGGSDESSSSGGDEEELSVDDIQNMLNVGSPSEEAAAAPAEEGSQEELNDLLSSMGVGGGEDSAPAAEEKPVAEPAAEEADSENMSLDEIQKMVAEKSDEEAE